MLKTDKYGTCWHYGHTGDNYAPVGMVSVMSQYSPTPMCGPCFESVSSYRPPVCGGGPMYVVYEEGK